MTAIRFPAVATVQQDDAKVRVTQWRFAPGTETKGHIHEFDYVVVPITNGRLTVETPDAMTNYLTISAGQSYSKPAGTEHNVANDTDHDIVFVEIEFKK